LYREQKIEELTQIMIQIEDLTDEELKVENELSSVKIKSVVDKETSLKDALRKKCLNNIAEYKQELENEERNAKLLIKRKLEDQLKIQEGSFKHKKIRESEYNKKDIKSNNTENIQEMRELEDELQREIEELKAKLEEQLADELIDYKLGLKSEKEMLKNEKHIALEIEAIWKLKNKKHNEIEENFKIALANIKKTYSLSQLPSSSNRSIDMNVQNNDDLVKKLNSEIIELKTILDREENEYKGKLKESLTQDEFSYEKKIQKKLKSLDTQISTLKSKTITEEITNLQNESDDLEGGIEQMNAQLNLHVKRKQNLLNEITALEHKVEADNSELKELESILKQKERELSNMNITQSNNDFNKIINNIQEVKHIIVQKERRAKTAEKQRKKNKIEQSFAIRHKANTKENMEKNQIDPKAKLREIALFALNEKEELKNKKTHLSSDYEIISYLLKNLEQNRREWRNKFYEAQGDNQRKVVAESIKEKLDEEIQSFTKQLDKIKAQMLLNEKKITIIKTFDNKLKLTQSSIKEGEESVKVIEDLKREYVTYMQKYKYTKKSKARRKHSNYQQVVGEIESILSPQLTSVGKSYYPKKQRNKSIYNIKKKYTFV